MPDNPYSPPVVDRPAPPTRISPARWLGWLALATLAAGLVPHVAGDGYAVLGALLGERDFSLDAREADLSRVPDDDARRSMLAEIRHTRWVERFLVAQGFATGLALGAQLIAFSFCIAALAGRRGLLTAAIALVVLAAAGSAFHLMGIWVLGRSERWLVAGAIGSAASLAALPLLVGWRRRWSG